MPKCARMALGRKRCVAAGHKNGGHLYSFQDQIRRTRDKWEPTDHSRLLKPDAVPSIFEKPASLKRKIEDNQ